jgi:hypothetical protein
VYSSRRPRRRRPSSGAGRPSSPVWHQIGVHAVGMAAIAAVNAGAVSRVGCRCSGPADAVLAENLVRAGGSPRPGSLVLGAVLAGGWSADGTRSAGGVWGVTWQRRGGPECSGAQHPVRPDQQPIPAEHVPVELQACLPKAIHAASRRGRRGLARLNGLLPGPVSVPRAVPSPQPGSRCASPPLRMFPACPVLVPAEGNIRSPADRRV